MTNNPTRPGSARHREEDLFEECLREHGQLASQGCAELPPGATHQVTVNEKGERRVTRKRCSAF